MKRGNRERSLPNGSKVLDYVKDLGTIYEVLRFISLGESCSGWIYLHGVGRQKRLDLSTFTSG